MLRIDGKTLLEIRKEIEYAKNDMCVSVGCSLTAMTNWERGNATPRAANVQSILIYLSEIGYDGEYVATY